MANYKREIIDNDEEEGNICVRVFYIGQFQVTSQMNVASMISKHASC